MTVRLKVALLLALGVGAATMTTACEFGKDPLLSELAHKEANSPHAAGYTVLLPDLINGEAHEFVIVCPYVPRAEFDKIGYPSSAIPEYGLDDDSNGIMVKFANGKTGLKRYSISKINVCANPDAGYRTHGMVFSGERKATFVRHQENGSWWLLRLTEN